MPVNCVVADVYLTIREPSVKILVTLINNLGVHLMPVDALSFSIKEGVLLLNAVFVNSVVLQIDEVVCRLFRVGDVFVDGLCFNHDLYFNN